MKRKNEVLFHFVADLLDGDCLEDDGARVDVLPLLPLLLVGVDDVPLDDLEPLSGGHLLQGGDELPDVVVVAVEVVVEDLEAQPPPPVPVAQLPGADLHGQPGRAVVVLDPLAAVDQGVAAVRVQPGDGEEGVALAEDVLLVQVGAGQLEADLVLQPGPLLRVDGQHPAVPGVAAVRGQTALELGKKKLDPLKWELAPFFFFF